MLIKLSGENLKTNHDFILVFALSENWTSHFCNCDISESIIASMNRIRSKWPRKRGDTVFRGDRVVYACSGVCPSSSVNHFQRPSHLEPLGTSKPFYVDPPSDGERNYYMEHPGRATYKNATFPRHQQE